MGFGRACAPLRFAHPFLSSLTFEAWRCAPLLAHRSFAAICLHHTLCILRRALQFPSSCEANKKNFPPSFHWTTEALKGVMYTVPQSLCCRIIWVPPLPFPWRVAPPLCLSIPVCIAQITKSYDSTGTLVLYLYTVLTKIRLRL